VLLALKGYRLRHRNWTGAGGELDLVVSRGSTVVFVEVKARRSAELGGPVGAVGPAKQRVVARAAAAYLSRFDLWGRRGVRFDIVAFEGRPGFPWWRVRHLRDAFRADYGPVA